MIFIKKYRFLLIIINILSAMQTQPVSTKNDTFVWEKYISLQSLGVITAGIILYNFMTSSKDINFQNSYKTIAQDVLKSSQDITIYHPDKNCNSKNSLQILCNQTQHTIIHLDASDNHRHNLILLFDQAIKLSPCIVYIEKKSNNKETKKTFLKEILELKNMHHSVVVIGHAKQKNITSIDDIFTLNFNIENDNPSYQERIEFLHLLASIENNINFDIEYIARKTIAFSYPEIIDFIQKIKCLSLKNQYKDLTKNYFVDKAYQESTKSECMNKDINFNLYRTSVHEIGHAIVAMLFPYHFILHNVTLTPQFTNYSIIHDCTKITSKQIRYEHKNELIPYYENHIMLYFAGKIAEQIFFGLPDKQLLNADNGYNNLINNPGCAQDDLDQAKKFVNKITEITKYHFFKQTEHELMKDLYVKTLNLLLPYKNKIQQCAQLLEQQEFLSGSQIRKMIHENN